MFIMFYITNPNRAVAKKVATRLLNKKLIACANVLPIADSMYRWKGRVKNTQEWALIAKTSSKKANAVEAEIRKIHPYEIPCIIKLSAKANNAFEQWLKGELI